MQERQKIISPTPCQIISCPVCSGKAFEGALQCTSCHGQSHGLWIEGWWIYWGGQVSLLTILMERVERAVRVSIDAALFIAGVSGFVWLGWLIWSEGIIGADVFLFTQSGDQRLVWFWFSCVADVYMMYRLSRESEMRHRVVVSTQQQSRVFTWQDKEHLHRRSYRDAFAAFHPSSRHVVQSAWRIARTFGSSRVLPLHVLAALIASGKLDLVLARLSVNSFKLVTHIKHLLRQRASPEGNNFFSSESIRVFLCAYAEASRAGHAQVEPIDLLVGLVDLHDVILDEIFRDQLIESDRVRHVSAWITFHHAFNVRVRSSRARAQFKPKGEMNRSFTAVVTPLLDSFSHDLTLYARAGAFDPLVNRDNEMTSLFQKLNAGHRGIMIVGEKGTGRTAFLEGIAQRMAAEDVPARLMDRRLVSISVGALVAGATGLGTFEQRMLGILGEAQRSGNIVLCFENIHELVGIGSGGSESLDLAQVLTDAFERSSLLIIATTTPAAWAKVIEPSDLAHTFDVIRFEELDFDTMIRILESKAPAVESRAQALFSYPSLEALIRFSDRYLHEQQLPEKAIHLMEEVAQKVSSERGAWSIISEIDVAAFVSAKTSIPLTAVTGDETQKLLALEDLMHARVVGQDAAVSAVAAALRRARTQLREEKRPIVNLLFLGPTGVGKTEVAKSLAEVYFGSEEVMVRFDMSEFQHPGSIERLIGVTGGPPGQLTEIVRRRPFVLILLDEIEKSHREILNVFLQVMDDGRLTDASTGITIDFTNTIIIATSNAGSLFIQDAVRRGDSVDKIRADLLERELRESFSPEWLNRFDNIIVFKPLSLADVEQIARLMMDTVIKRLAEKEINLVVHDEVFKELAQAGFSPEYGARPLRRALQDKVEDSLAKIMLQYRIGRRDTVTLGTGFTWNIEKARKL